MPAGTGAVVTASAVGSLVEGEAAALRRLAQNPAGPTLTGKGSGTILQLQSQRKIDELAAQFNNPAVQPKDFQISLDGKVLKADPEVSLGAPVYAGATTADVMSYFRKLAGVDEIPTVRTVAGKGDVF